MSDDYPAGYGGDWPALRGPEGPCEDCLCCSADQCRIDPFRGHGCPRSSRTDESICPCTCE